MTIEAVALTPELQAWIDEGFAAYNAQNGYTHVKEDFVYEWREAGERLAVANGAFYGGWCFLSGLLVAESARGKGIGAQLLAYVEAAARKKGAYGVHLTTISFQAPQFYEKQGYTRFGELSPFGNSTRCYYAKRLTPAADAQQ